MNEAERLRTPCVGAPYAKVQWPHAPIHRAADALDDMARALRYIANGREREMLDGTTEVGDVENAAEIADAALVRAGYAQVGPTIPIKVGEKVYVRCRQQSGTIDAIVEKLFFERSVVWYSITLGNGQKVLLDADEFDRPEV